jgi:hypothetical protein
MKIFRESESVPVLKGISEIEVHKDEVYLVSYEDNKKISQLLGEDISFEDAKPILERYFFDLGLKQAKEKKVLSGDSLPWSRSLEGGESAFTLDQRDLGKNRFSEVLWTAYTENLPVRDRIIKESTSKWGIR